MSQLVKSIIATCLLVRAICAVSYDISKPLIPGFQMCHFQNKTYEIGKKFHPLVKMEDVTYEAICTICTCNPTTLVRCTETVCPPLNCSNPIRLEGECCEKCPEVELVPASNPCLLNNLLYQHGEVFHPIATNETNPYCSSCKCNNGSIKCEDVSLLCPIPAGCDEADQYVPEGHCCKTCPNPDLSNGECLDERNHVRQNKESWQPVFQGFVASCINCTCTNSSVDCKRLPCPPAPPCEPGVVETYIRCCPKCTRDTNTQPPPTVSTTTTPDPIAPTLTTDPYIPCDTSKYTHKVYLCNETLAMAIEDTRNNTVQLYNWLNGGVKDIQYLSSKTFYLTECMKKYQGRALERRVSGLTNRETKKKKIEDCTKECAKMVVTMLRPVPDDELCES